MESLFGHDFSRVRVHSDSTATRSAQALHARAYTVASDIVFDSTYYDPRSPSFGRLLAHELAHVVQQGGGTQATSVRVTDEGDQYEREAEQIADQVAQAKRPAQPASISSGVLQRAKICSKRLEAPVIGWFFNHAYIDDTGRDDCLGSRMVGNYAVQTLVQGNFRRGCAVKTDRSTDPQGRTPNIKPCDPKPGVADLSRCLRDTFNSYADPSVYANPKGPNSNTFAGTLARACCADPSSSGLGIVPGWDHPPAPPCAWVA